MTGGVWGLALFIWTFPLLFGRNWYAVPVNPGDRDNLKAESIANGINPIVASGELIPTALIIDLYPISFGD
jgi:hypothetical protein